MDVKTTANKITDKSNKYFDNNPTVKTIAKSAAITGAIVAPGGMLALPAVYSAIDKKDAKKKEKQMKQKIAGFKAAIGKRLRSK